MTEEMTPEARTALRNVYAFLLRRHYASLGTDSQQSCQPLPTTPQTLESQSPEIKAEIVDEATA
ncbi:MAG TPA: hypothetical protein PKV20_02590 [Anaerolineae bacterium]|nr:hypothetical protein [Anaerolineae bacterium]